jgi:antitoxin MazE
MSTTEAAMKTKIVRIGNSRGVRIPKPLLEQAGLENDVFLRVVEDGIVIEAANRPRTGWTEAARVLHERREDGLLDGVVLTDFDESEWVWE